MAHIDGRAVFGERELDDLDGAVDAGAEAARRRDIDGQRKEACLRPDLLAHASHLRPGNDVKRLKRRPSRALSGRSTGDSLTANFGETGCQDLIQAFAGLAPRHIRRGGPACQAEDGDKLRRSCALWLMPFCRAGSLLLVPRSSCRPAPSPASPIPSNRGRRQPLPVSQDGMLAEAKADAPQMAALPTDSLHCPQVVAWPHDRLLTIYADGQVGDTQAIMHRGEITKTCARVPDLWRPRGGEIWLCRARAAWTEGRAGAGDAAGQHQGRRRRPQGAGERQGRASRPSCRRKIRSAISPWSRRSPSPSPWARGPRTIRCSSPSSAPRPARGSRPCRGHHCVRSLRPSPSCVGKARGSFPPAKP